MRWVDKVVMRRGLRPLSRHFPAAAHRATLAPAICLSTSASSSGGAAPAAPPRLSIWDGTAPALLAKESITLSKADADVFNRWSIMPRAFMNFIPTGAVYAWSMWQLPLTTCFGTLAPAAADWGVAEVGTTFSCLAVGFGVTVGGLGPWMASAGPRYASLVGATLFGGGHLLAAAGVYTHTLPLVWLGWGVCGGLGWGLSYISSVSALLAWFPDKKGLASGIGIAVFAGGGLFAAPMIERLRQHFFSPPTFAGAMDAVESKIEAGRPYAHLPSGEWAEAVFVSSKNIATAPVSDGLLEGYYLVGTGDNGAMGAFATLGLLYGATMGLGAWSMKLPPTGWTPPGYTVTSPSTPSASAAPTTEGSVSAATAMRTPQFVHEDPTSAVAGSLRCC